MARDLNCRAVNPEDPAGEPIDVIIPGDLYLRYYKYAPVRYENLRAAKFVLEHPKRIFWGVREYNEGGWGYVGRPRHWYVTEEKTEPFPADRVFAVYLSPNMRVYECRAEYVADDDRMAPKNWRDRYRGLVWKSTS